MTMDPDSLEVAERPDEHAATEIVSAPASPASRPAPAALPPTQLTEFMELCARRTGRELGSHTELQRFSVEDWRRFWALALEWSNLIWEGPMDPVCVGDGVEDATFFPKVHLNYAENLLRIDSPEDGERPAIVARHPDRPPDRLSRRELRERVRVAAAQLRGLGVGPGDRVAAIGGNNAEMAIGGLASVALGASFSTGAPEMGVAALLSRFEQLRPKVLLAGFGEPSPALAGSAGRIAEVSRGLPTLRAVVALDDAAVPADLQAPVARLARAGGEAEGTETPWPRFGFNHPLFVLFSSGTTGPPKCIVHGAGGTLLEHVKEHRLHVDLGPDDRLLFHTSTAWMMWHWQLSALASGSTIVLYDGPLAGPDTLWRLVDEEAVTVLGTSPPYLQLCQDSDITPRGELSLESLRAILSTGSILHDWQYDWVREKVGSMPLQSISGGSDIIGCFVLGNPNLPVRRGRIQCRSLGMDVQAAPSANAPEGVGELVCRNPFPSRPLGFLGDDGGAFRDAYFSQNPGVWTHGDLIEFDAEGGARIHGRSDGTLNVRGIRIGPAEIYRALADVAQVKEAMAVEQGAPDSRGSSRLVLLVVLHEGAELDTRLEVAIRSEVGRHTSPAHVPDLVVQVGELPTTHSGKRSERAARDALAGGAVANSQALANPGSLEGIRAAVASADERRAGLRTGASDATEASTEARVRAIWERVIGIAPLLPQDNFFEIGGTSLVAVRLLQEVRDRLGVDLPLSTVIWAPTPATMAAVIDSPPERRFPMLVPQRAGTDGRALFLIHPVSGDVLPLRPLAMALDTPRPVYGIQALGLDPRAEPQRSIGEMADTYADVIRAAQPAGPYAIGGYSFGALVAFEIARRLEAAGETVDWLGLVDPELDERCLPLHVRWWFRVKEPLRVLRWMLAAPRARLPALLRSLRRNSGGWGVSAGPSASELPPRLRRLTQIGLAAFRDYRPSSYGGSATLFMARRRRHGTCDPVPVWARAVLGSLRVERIAGDHLEMLAPASVGELAAAVSRDLATR